MSLPPEALATRRLGWMRDTLVRLANMAAQARDGDPDPEGFREEMLLALADYPEAPAS